jgi:hypothetical protein
VRVPFDKIVDYKGKVIALERGTNAILAAEDTFESLRRLMHREFPGQDYTAYGVPTAQDYEVARSLQSESD